MTHGRANDMVLETTTTFVVVGAVLAFALVAYGLLIMTGLLPDWLASSSPGIASFSQRLF